ncbi:MAG: hypothetical protein KGH71_02305 [Candidatus Micrarchaeota archaeon]|nr:hypothetical protein [Candidatus Micrarchaeota archaeon]
MSSAGQSLIFSIIPVLLGLALFLLLTLFNPASKKYVITQSSLVAKSADCTPIPKPCMSPSKVYVYDQLILRGHYVKEEERSEAAFSKFGLLEIGNLSHLAKGNPAKNLEIISTASNCDVINRLSCSNSPLFAALLPYLLDSSLKMVIV